jgi:hypothetical protein
MELTIAFGATVDFGPAVMPTTDAILSNQSS